MTVRPARGRGDTATILEVAGLRKVFLTRKSGWFGGEGRQVIAVDDIGFAVARGETLAIVGESGSRQDHGQQDDHAGGPAR